VGLDKTMGKARLHARVVPGVRYKRIAAWPSPLEWPHKLHTAANHCSRNCEEDLGRRTMHETVYLVRKSNLNPPGRRGEQAEKDAGEPELGLSNQVEHRSGDGGINRTC
jgi:hypothetical protein